MIQKMDFTKRFEKIPVEVYTNSSDAALTVAESIISTINRNSTSGKKTVLALDASSPCVLVYEALANACKKGDVSFKNVVVFSLDEYYPLDKMELQSHYRFLKEYLFDLVDIDEKNIHCVESSEHDDLTAYCSYFESLIEKEGGIDILVTSGMASNEPGAALNTRTHVVTLNYISRLIAAGDFFGVENVPHKAITMGIDTLMSANKVFLLAFGEGSPEEVAKVVEGAVTDQVPASFFQTHKDVTYYIDQPASIELTRIKTPWLVGSCKWNFYLIKKAVFWLCRKLDKPILKLTDRDYNDNGLGEMISGDRVASKINIDVFNDLQHAITGWPGGKPNADDSTRPERALPYPKRVIVFSPHPDDDVISMGGTIARLSEQGHDVHIAYETSGNIAVFDHEIVKYVDVLRQLEKIDDKLLHVNSITGTFDRIQNELAEKHPGEPDKKEVRELKTALRRGEAKSASRYLGIMDDHVHFLNLPFYETGGVKKNPLSQADIDIVKKLLEEVQPHQVFAAGDLSDPHGTHRVCTTAVIEALHQLKDEPWIKDCRVWFYRGAWQEWDVTEAEMAVPLSPEEVVIKREAIFRHQSQKDRPLFPGADPREFWKRAEDRNHNTAIIFDKLGMAEYQAIELFKQYKIK
ncbi:MAG: PIG-L family deacetylase [Bacteroidales bacterium]|jgi:glucosamine-6-phosphate deaminase|nr:PIG-L family deacetylase [Bacteroidales bacterium]MCI2122510.1 PIG-L family deacetylase [Bacteroidales bacterium]MCI2144791.1 PIG-L family deacetylase [Bacteroidales bacterium]